MSLQLKIYKNIKKISKRSHYLEETGLLTSNSYKKEDYSIWSNCLKLLKKQHNNVKRIRCYNKGTSAITIKVVKHIKLFNSHLK